MKTLPNRFIIKLIREFLLMFFAMAGIYILAQVFILNIEQTRDEIISAVFFAGLISTTYIFLDWKEWKSKLSQIREESHLRSEHD